MILLRNNSDGLERKRAIRTVEGSIRFTWNIFATLCATAIKWEYFLRRSVILESRAEFRMSRGHRAAAGSSSHAPWTRPALRFRVTWVSGEYIRWSLVQNRGSTFRKGKKWGEATHVVVCWTRTWLAASILSGYIRDFIYLFIWTVIYGTKRPFSTIHYF